MDCDFLFVWISQTDNLRQSPFSRQRTYTCLTLTCRPNPVTLWCVAAWFHSLHWQHKSNLKACCPGRLEKQHPRLISAEPAVLPLKWLKMKRLRLTVEIGYLSARLLAVSRKQTFSVIYFAICSSLLCKDNMLIQTNRKTMIQKNNLSQITFLLACNYSRNV